MLPEITLYFDHIQIRLDFIKDCLVEIGTDAEQLNWRPALESPSIFSLAAYVAMNTDYWIGHVLGNLPEPAGFDSVLEQAFGNDSGPLIYRLDSSRETTRQVFERLEANNLDATINFNDELITTRQCILHAVEEAAERCGEIRTMRHWWGSE